MKLIITSGLAGSGKTTFSKEFARQQNWMYIDKDIINDSFMRDNDCLYDLEFKTKRDSDHYVYNVRGQSYICALNLAVENCTLGNNVILDGYFGTNLVYEEFKNYINSITKDFDVYYVFFNCSKEKLFERVKARALGRDEEKINDFEEYYNKHYQIHKKFNYDIEINTEKNLEENIKKLKELVN